jgi:hypothetical protein
MRNFTLLDSVDASVQQISDAKNLERHTEWVLRIDSVGLDGIPQLFIEEGFNGGKCLPEPTDWNVVPFKCDDTGTFDITTSEVNIRSKQFLANWFRIRIEPNGNTTGAISVILSYKDYT